MGCKSQKQHRMSAKISAISRITTPKKSELGNVDTAGGIFQQHSRDPRPDSLRQIPSPALGQAEEDVPCLRQAAVCAFAASGLCIGPRRYKQHIRSVLPSIKQHNWSPPENEASQSAEQKRGTGAKLETFLQKGTLEASKAFRSSGEFTRTAAAPRQSTGPEPRPACVPRHAGRKSRPGAPGTQTPAPLLLPGPSPSPFPRQPGDFHFVPFLLGSPSPPQRGHCRIPGPHLGPRSRVPRGRPPAATGTRGRRGPHSGSGWREAAPVTRLALGFGLGLRLHKAQGGGGRAARRVTAAGPRGAGRGAGAAAAAAGGGGRSGAQSPARPRAAAKGGLDRRAARRPGCGLRPEAPRGTPARYLGFLLPNSGSRPGRRSTETSSPPRRARAEGARGAGSGLGPSPGCSVSGPPPGRAESAAHARRTRAAKRGGLAPTTPEVPPAQDCGWPLPPGPGLSRHLAGRRFTTKSPRKLPSQ